MIEIPKEWLGNNDYFVMRTNEYVFPTIRKIKGSDIVIVERNSNIGNGDIVVYQDENKETKIKRWTASDLGKRYIPLGKVKYILNEI